MDKNYYRGQVVEKDLLCNVYKKVFINNNKKSISKFKRRYKEIRIYINKNGNRLSKKF